MNNKKYKKLLKRYSGFIFNILELYFFVDKLYFCIPNTSGKHSYTQNGTHRHTDCIIMWLVVFRRELWSGMGRFSLFVTVIFSRGKTLPSCGQNKRIFLEIFLVKRKKQQTTMYEYDTFLKKTNKQKIYKALNL